MSHDENDNSPKRGKKPNPYADKPYEVGKGKAPKAHQFRPGNKAGRGRRRGSRNKTDLEKLLNRKVVSGHDSLGRPIRTRLGEAVDRKLVQAALDGGLPAIKVIKEWQLRMRDLELRHGPPPLTGAELRKQAEEQAERERLSSQLVGLLEDEAQRKRRGGRDVHSRHPDLPSRAREALREYLERRGDTESPDYWLYGPDNDKNPDSGSEVA